MCHNETKSKIKKLEDDVRRLKFENKKLAQMYSMASDKSQDIPSGQVSEAVNARSNIPMSIKFKCDMCDANFKKKSTLEKHMNSKHNKTDCSPNKKIGEGQFGFAFDVIPGQETEAEVLRLEWREQNKYVNTSNEKEKNGGNDKF